MRFFFRIFANLLLIGFLCIFKPAFSESSVPIEKSFVPTASIYASWTFLGNVESEVGEVYSYFFELQRNAQTYHIKLALFDNQTKKLIFKEDSVAILEEQPNYKWLVGRAFLKYDTITNSWVFGLKMPNKHGFNFRVGMLDKSENSHFKRLLPNGVAYLLTQTDLLNGHINFEENDQFVTSKDAWFLQIWSKTNSVNLENLSSLLCRFEDGRALYSIKSSEVGVAHNIFSGLFDSEGKSLRVSQFINITKTNDSTWDIAASVPKMRLILPELLKGNDFIAGYFTDKSLSGFCLINK